MTSALAEIVNVACCVSGVGDRQGRRQECGDRVQHQDGERQGTVSHPPRAGDDLLAQTPLCRPGV